MYYLYMYWKILKNHLQMHIQKIQSKIYAKKKTYLIHFWITCASIFSLHSESELQLTFYMVNFNHLCTFIHHGTHFEMAFLFLLKSYWSKKQHFDTVSQLCQTIWLMGINTHIDIQLYTIVKKTAFSPHNIVSTVFWVCMAHRALPGSSGTIIVNMTRYDIDDLYF